MKTRDLLHFALLIPALAGVFLIIAEFTKANSGSISGASFGESNSEAWRKIVEVMPIDMPQKFPDMIESDITESSDLPVQEKARFDENNAFIICSSILVLFGVLGVGFAGAAKTQSEPAWNPLLRIAAITGVAFFSFYLWGFNLAYPGDFNGFLPSFFPGPPALTDPLEYGMEGMNEFTDLFYISAYAAFFGALLISQTAGKQTAVSAFIPAIPIVAFALPLAISWKWGGGWLDSSFLSYDFAGAALFHWHAGAVALVTGIVLKLFRRKSESSPTTRAPIRLAWWIPGIVFYFMVMIGMNAGSVLAATPNMVATCLQSTLYAAGTAAAIAGIFGIFLKTRTIIEWVGHGLIAGAVIVSGVCDSLSTFESIALGIIAGVFIPPVIFFLDRFLAIDPLAVAGVHGLAGLIGTLAAIPFGEDITVIGQLLLLLTVPLISLAFASLSAIVLGLLKLLFFEKPNQKADSQTSPPPIPQR